MITKRQVVLCVLAGVFWPVVCFSVSDDEFSRDYAHATDLREAGDVNGLESLASQINTIWSAKDRNMRETLAVHVLRSWRSVCENPDRKMPLERVRHLAAQVLASMDPNDVGSTAIKNELDVVAVLHDEYTYTKGRLSDREWLVARREGTERWLHAWQRLEKAIDPNWDPNGIPIANVSPPEGVFGIPGMSPELIKDPGLRAKYEEDIAKNNEKIRVRNEQLKLRSIRLTYARIIKKYLTDTYSIPPYDDESLVALVKSKVKDQQTSNAFLGGADTRRRQQP